MFRSVKQIGTITCWGIILMTVIAIFVAATSGGSVSAREAPNKPYIQPGDGDGPAGVCEVIPGESWSLDPDAKIVGPVEAKQLYIDFCFWVHWATLEMQLLPKSP